MYSPEVLTVLHRVRVVTPDGCEVEVDSCGECGLRRALRVAGSLAGWLGVDEWESASRFTPAGVERFVRELQEDFPGVTPHECAVIVVTPGDGADAVNGWEEVARYAPGSVVPEIVANLRREAKEGGWREDAGHEVRGPRSISVRATRR
jgi:hypothetical protein